MSSSTSFVPKFVVFLFIISCNYPHFPLVEAQIHDIGFDWSSSAMSSMIYSGGDTNGDNIDNFYELDDDVSSSDIDGRRSLYWKRVYYISYGALSANRVPCPPRSGRSYYTHNCYGARGPANPYYRGCSCITRCRRR